MQNLIVLTSPPASGKTYWIKSLAEVIGPETLLIISPLRALADECKEKWGDEIKIMTPEEWILKPIYCETVVFDEFHLNFYWGDTFRPLLWEVFFGLAVEAKITVLLTATLAESMKIEVEFYGSQFDEMYLCDFGNQKLKFPPKRYYKAPSKCWIRDLVVCGPRGGGVNLIFCAYRNEVDHWEQHLKKLGYTVWSCKGGEAQLMREKMNSNEVPDFIVATSVLSHGVNLPQISCIFFLYQLNNIDFWIQMVARGGRKGEEYEVIALELPYGLKWNQWTNFLAILGLSLKMRLNSLIQEMDQWFLKESS